MRSHHFVLFSALVCLLGLTTGTVFAQNPYARPGYVPPRSQPVLSPWLNLANGGNPALNYFNGVIPQRTFGNQINQLQTSVAANQQALLGLQAASPLGTTGHTVTFLSFQQYFNTFGSAAAGAGGRRGGVGGSSAGIGGASALGSGLGSSSGLSSSGSRIR